MRPDGLMFAAVLYCLSKRGLLKAIPIAALAELSLRICLIGCKWLSGSIDGATLREELIDTLKGAVCLDLVEEIVRIFKGNSWKLMSHNEEDVEYFYAHYYAYSDQASKSFFC